MPPTPPKHFQSNQLLRSKSFPLEKNLIKVNLSGQIPLHIRENSILAAPTMPLRQASNASGSPKLFAHALITP